MMIRHLGKLQLEYFCFGLNYIIFQISCFFLNIVKKNLCLSKMYMTLIVINNLKWTPDI